MLPIVQIGDTNNRDFSERKLDVLHERTTGDSNAEIAQRLSIAPSTVKFHVQNMISKTGSEPAQSSPLSPEASVLSSNRAWSLEPGVIKNISKHQPGMMRTCDQNIRTH